MDSEAALVRGFLFARFSSKRTWCCCRVAALSVKFTSFCGQAGKGGLIDMTYILSLGDDGSACRLKAIYSSGSGFCACLCLREVVMEVSVSAMQLAYSRLQCKLIIWPQKTRGLDPSVRWHDLMLMLRMLCDALG